MKILLVNKFYHQAARSGGVGRYIFELQKMLEQHGHTVIPFAVKDRDVVANPYLGYFPTAHDFSRVRFDATGLKAAVSYFHNREAARKLEELIKKEKPDLAHIHNIYHHLTPSIFRPLRRHNVPVVMTIHDYKLICPNQSLFTRNQRCQRCRRRRYYNCIRYRCVKNSRLASALAALEMTWSKATRSYEKNVARFISPSQFTKDTCVKFGLSPSQITVLPYALESSEYQPNFQTGRYFIYFGRLAPEKGLGDLLSAMSLVKQPGILKIVGDGPQRPALEQMIKAAKLADRVVLEPFASGIVLRQMVQGASFVVVPSRWYDNSPLAIYESMLHGKAVIGPNHGGIPELIRSGQTGYLYRSDDVRDLAQKIDELLSHPQTAVDFGRQARRVATDRFLPAKHYQQLMQIYREVLG